MMASLISNFCISSEKYLFQMGSIISACTSQDWGIPLEVAPNKKHHHCIVCHSWSHTHVSYSWPHKRQNPATGRRRGHYQACYPLFSWWERFEMFDAYFNQQHFSSDTIFSFSAHYKCSLILNVSAHCKCSWCWIKCIKCKLFAGKVPPSPLPALHCIGQHLNDGDVENSQSSFCIYNLKSNPI